MSEGQKRKVGMGMKPRGEQAKGDASSESLPTEEGQAESIIQPILDRQEGEQGGDHLEADPAQNLEPETVADSKALEEALKASAEGDGARCCPRDDDGDGNCDIHSSPGVFRNLRIVSPAAEVYPEGGQVVELTPEGGPVEGILQSDSGYAIDMPRPRQARIWSLGEQPNGDFQIVTTIQESYVEPVRQWAQEAGLTVEEWINHQLAGYLENWGSPAKGR